MAAKKGYVLTGRSASMTFRIPVEGEGNEKVLTLERGVPVEADAEFSKLIDDYENTPEMAIYKEGSVPEDAIVGPPSMDEPAPDIGGNTAAATAVAVGEDAPEDTRAAQVSSGDADAQKQAEEQSSKSKA